MASGRPAIDELSRLLGGIEAKVDLVNRTQSEDRVSSASWRTDIRQNLSTIREDLDELKAGLVSVTDTVNDMKPAVDDYRERRAEARGMSRLGHLIAALGGGSLALAAQWALRKFGA